LSARLLLGGPDIAGIADAEGQYRLAGEAHAAATLAVLLPELAKEQV